MALCSRVVRSGVNSAIFFAKSRAINPSSCSSFGNRFDYRHISQLVRPNNNKRAFLVDTLALVRLLEFLFLFRSFCPINWKITGFFFFSWRWEDWNRKACRRSKRRRLRLRLLKCWMIVWRMSLILLFLRQKCRR